MKHSEYYRLTWQQYHVLLHGWERRRQRKWELIRVQVQASYAANPNRDPAKIPSVYKIMPLSLLDTGDNVAHTKRAQTKAIADYREKLKHLKKFDGSGRSK